MKIKRNVVLLMLVSVFAAYFIWQSFRSVDIVAIHQRDNFSDVLVNNFPYTDKGKINWWLKNKDRLKKEFDIPKPASYGSFTIDFWLFGDGYKEEGKYDRLCFDDMKGPINCIEKDVVFTVSNDQENRIHFTTYDGEYILKDNGEIKKYESHFEVF